jgi:hypothetical protein
MKSYFISRLEFRKIKYLIIIFIISTSAYSQRFDTPDWYIYDHSNTPVFEITKTAILKFQKLTFNIKWDPKLSYSDNLGYYGGISEMKIYYKNRLLQTIKNIEDGVAMNRIYMYLYDFNLDSYLDFKIRRDCGKFCYYSYFIYNPSKNQFEHNKEWDYVKIMLLNKKKQQLLTIPEGTALEGEQLLYQIEGLKLIKIKEIPYNKNQSIIYNK